jgi:preprotein translocase subunit SecY
MKSFIQTLKNIYKIEELRSRIGFTLLIILVYRLGSKVVLPGVNPELLEAFSQRASEGVLGLLDMFSGGAFSSASIFALGIMPYISASIIIQLLTIAVPYFQRMQKEGESGRRRMNQITRYLTVLVLIMQAPAYLTQIPLEARIMSPFMFQLSSIIILTAGTIFVMWMGEKITDKGIGNGISLIIMIGIVARLPFALFSELTDRLNGPGGLVAFLVEIIFLLLVIALSILLVQGTRRIPVQYAKRIVGNKQYGGVRQYIPLKVNAAGVMPIIFAQAIMFLPLSFARYGAGGEAMSKFVAAFSRYTSVWYNIIFALLIIVFTYFYTAIIMNPSQMAEDMKKNGGFIPGIKPGKRTSEFIDSVMSRITLPGSMFLAVIAILPAFAGLLGIQQSFAQFFGGTSLLILVGVVLDTLQQIESHLLMRHYDGLMKSGRVKGRAGGYASSM